MNDEMSGKRILIKLVRNAHDKHYYDVVADDKYLVGRLYCDECDVFGIQTYDRARHEYAREITLDVTVTEIGREYDPETRSTQ